MQIITMESQRLQERLVHAVLPNGMQVYIMPRRDNQQTYVSLSVQYGAASRHTLCLQDGREITVPDGVQHFLEHMVLVRPDGSNSYQAFQKREASMSAYTTHHITSFQFFCTGQLMANIIDLLNMVQTPYFPEAAVDMERRVIEQEIQMFAHEDDTRVLTTLLSGLYGKHHQLSTDVLGTVESISDINSDILQRCHELFYHPQNSILLIIGDVEPESVLTCVQAHQAKKTYTEWNINLLRLLDAPEQTTVHHSYLEQTAPLCLPVLSMGFKEKMQCYTHTELMELEQATQVAFEAIFGKQSHLADVLQQTELIEGELFYQVDFSKRYGYVWVACYTPHPQVVQQHVEEALQHALTFGIDEVAFSRAQQAVLVRFLRDFDDLFVLGARVSQNLARSFSELEMELVLAALTPRQVTHRLRTLLDPERIVVSILHPQE